MARRPAIPLVRRLPPLRRGRLDGGPFRPLPDYGVIGDLRTAALVSRHGTIDWACFPRFDAPSVFAALLDPGRGGSAGIAPTEHYESAQAYVPSTNILETRFRVGRRRNLYVTDFMPAPGAGRLPGGPSSIVRIVEAEGGSIATRIWVEPGFRYGTRPAAWAARDATGWSARAGSDRLDVDLPEGAAARGSRLEATVELGPDDGAAVELTWGGPRPPGPGAIRRLHATEAYWRDWTHRPDAALHRIAGRWHRWVERSELLLKLLSSAGTGAFVAAPTTSLPEWPGGPRNWDYRFVWIRDAALSAQAMLLLGHRPEARAYFAWIVDRLGAARGPAGLRVLYDVEGREGPAERELRHLRGYRDSRPVRVGNDARTQFQLDIYGEVLDFALLLFRAGDERFVHDRWSELARLVDEVALRWGSPDHGLWEVRGPPRHFVHSKLMAWVALDRALRISDAIGHPGTRARWTEARAAVRDWLLTEGLDARHGRFVQAPGSPNADAANLRVPLVGFLPFDDPRVVATVAAVERELARGPFVFRYRAPDRIAGPEGTFLPCAFWRIECLVGAGRSERALSDWERLLAVASPHGLFPEEYDPVRGVPLGNYPQAFTHIALLRAALAVGIDLAAPRLRDEVAWALSEEGVAERAHPERLAGTDRRARPRSAGPVPRPSRRRGSDRHRSIRTGRSRPGPRDGRMSS